jgi:NADH-ubiquinone oxidoreductase chain 2
MLITSLIILILITALPSFFKFLPENCYNRISAIVLLFCAILSFNTLNIENIGSGIAIYGGLFHITIITQFMDIILFLIAGLILIAWPLIKNNQSFQPELSKIEEEPSIKNNIKSSVSSGENIGSYAINEEKKIKNISYSTNYSLIILFSLLGSSLLISSYDLISMYLSIELQSFAVYVLATLYKNSESSTNAGLKYFLLGGLSSCFILFGAGLIYAFTGLTNLESIYSLISVSEINNIINNDFNINFILSKDSGGLGIMGGFFLGIIFIIVGFLFKIAAAPLHNWSPDVYDDTPTIVTIWLTIMPKISILIFLLELYTGFKSLDILVDNNYLYDNINLNDSLNISSILRNLLLMSSLLSLLIGSVVGLVQIRIKRLLAYSTISHIGFILLALAINTEQSVDSFLFYIIQYTITNLNIFLIIIALGYIYNQSIILKDIKYISDFKGQFFSNPLICLSFSICLFSMAGVPPLIGFFSKQYVLYSAVQSGYIFMSFICILVSVISASYYLKIIKVLMDEITQINNNKNFDKQINSNSILYSKNNQESSYLILSNYHSFLISTLTLSILLFILKPSLILNSTQLLSLSLFNF